ncbi:MAG: hypothetical protein ONB43_25915 [candidate division KSB1 bacterium]|nr:hypothetical protein [candidate division KSB1 bacterium]
MKKTNGHVNETFCFVDLIYGLLLSSIEEIGIITQLPCIASASENFAKFFINKPWFDEVLAKKANDARMLFGLQSFAGKQSICSRKIGVAVAPS